MKTINELNKTIENNVIKTCQQVCPNCGNKYLNYFKVVMNIWKCSKCKGQFQENNVNDNSIESAKQLLS